MTDWTGGYVSDIEYVPGFYREQSPGQLDLACLLCGVEPPRRLGAGESFTYCEIGCGQGTTVMALAAASPEGDFHAIDFMPAHIARAEETRQRAGLGNVSFMEADVVALADGDGAGLPAFDYITLHGVYSWVSPAVRAGVVRFLNRFLKPGGVVYVSYNAQPAWSAIAPTQRMLYEFAATVQASSDERARSGIEFVKKMMAAGSPAISGNAVDQLFDLKKATRSAPERVIYLAHEFLNGSWQPLYHMDVARDMVDAKLSFVGMATLPENFAGIGLSDEAKTVVNGLPDGPFRETAKDYFNGRGFRRDVFVRGRRAVAADERERRLAEAMLAPAVAPEDFKFQGDVLTTRIDLAREPYQAVFDALSEGPQPVGDLVGLAHDKGASVTATEVVGFLVGLRQALPVLCDVTTEGVEACARLNRVTLGDAFRADRRLSYALATPVGHSGLNVASVEALVLDGLFQGVPETVEALTAHVCDRAEADPAEIRHDAALVSGEAAVAEQAGDKLDTETPGGDKAKREAKYGAESDKSDDASRPLGERVARSVGWCLDEALPFWRKLGLAPPPR
ncbi:class I SAM-dependent methyltransferase [Fodinicurvata sp. EGI_FJ10296]|uniref:class I SAM-dependent methyltransferase n=1 Tax=Fodinicurvata sp. EGI_FJ10296 TaxID=3231908 RepID=UPI0034546E88